MSMSGGGGASSKVQFFGGQKGQAAKIFAPGGIFEQLLAGGPNIASEQAASRGIEGVERSFAAKGQEGSGLEARAISDAAFKGNVNRESAQLESLLAFMQPPGSKSGPAGPQGVKSWLTK